MYNTIGERKVILVPSADDGKALAELREEGYTIVAIESGIWDRAGNVYTWITAEKGELLK